MEAYAVAGCGTLLALFLLAKGVWLWHGERGLLKRLVATQGRVTGQIYTTSTVVSADANGNRTERLDFDHQATYEYRVGTQIHGGRASGAVAPFTAAQMPPNEIVVFYDIDAPTVSRLDDKRGDTTGQHYVIFAAVVLVVSALIALIPNLDGILATLTQ